MSRKTADDKGFKLARLAMAQFFASQTGFGLRQTS
jgi:hypothetical protein